ncbi:Protein-lysine methyltransferase METTL21B, partial [Durusdinium trenchii]
MAPPKAPATTERILELLKGEGLAGRQCAETTLEYRGQWQPKPNGAETGHGVVPQDWALDVASENDRQLASYGWAGGAQLCLSNAFGEAQRIEAQAQDLIENGCTEEDPSVQCIRAIARASEEREALMRRQWCDIDFQQGEEANQELLKHLERDFAGQLLHTAQRDLRQETTDEWYHIKRHDPVPGQVYLTASIGGESLELSGHDDASGRHRWQLLPEGQAEGRRTTASWHLIRLLGGTSPGRRLLSRGPSRRLELCDFDDGSGRQRWQVERTGTSTARIKPAHHSGDPGVGAARQVEESARGCFLGSAGSRVVLQEEAVQWKIQGPTGGFAGESFQDGGFSPE